jgi:hypothetical protein
MTDYMHNFTYTLIKGDEYIEIPTK